MKYSNGFGINGSKILLGTAYFGDTISVEESFRIMDTYRELGGTHIDTARLYADGESEKVIAKWFNSRKPEGMHVSSKGAFPNSKSPEIPRLSEAEVRYDLELSLLALERERIDFYWLHRDDTDRDIEEIIDMMEDFVREGKIRYYGASNYTLKRLLEAKKYAERAGVRGFSAVSNYWTMLRENDGFSLSSDNTIVTWRNADLEDVSRLGIPLVPFSSTAKGWVAKGAENTSDKLNLVFDNRENRAFREEVIKKAADESCPLQTAFLRTMSRYGENVGLQIIPITACSDLSQLEELLEF